MPKLTAADAWRAISIPRPVPPPAPQEEQNALSQPAIVGVLAFEIASLMAKAATLWRSLSDGSVAHLRANAIHHAGIRLLVSDDDDFLVGLAIAEISDSLNFLSCSVARLGHRCTDPLLRRLEHILSSYAGAPCGWELSARKMDGKVKKMERLVAATANLHQELEVLAELEQALRRAQHGGGGGDAARRLAALVEAKQKVVWQRQEVKFLRETSLWNKTFDCVVLLLAQSVLTIRLRIRSIFGLHPRSDRDDSSARILRSLTRNHSSIISFKSDLNCLPPPKSLPPRQKSRGRWAVSGPFKGCMAGANESIVLHSCMALDDASKRRSTYVSEKCHRRKLSAPEMLNANPQVLTSDPPLSTLGAAGLALHYANIIVVIEKLAASPHLIGPDARDDLYSMLTTSIRAALRARLKSYAKNLKSYVYDPSLAAEWNGAVARILEWLAPLARNMIRWQSERNFEQQHLSCSTNILLIQTLYYANQAKTEAAITELLVGLNYLWRYGKELSAKAILECLSGKNYDECLNLKDL